MHFSLVKIKPSPNTGPDGFDDAILPLYFALTRLGFQTEILFNRINPKSQNIIFGSCNAPKRVSRLVPANSIIFNLEQMFKGSERCNNNYLKHLRYFEVWDYSSANIHFFQKSNITATYVPLGYTPEMSRLSLHKKSTTDLLFYGRIEQRRDPIIKKLFASQVNILVAQNAFGNERDTLLCKSKAVLNIHAYQPARLEVVRLGYLWSNKIPVISERNHHTTVPDHLNEACIYAPYEDLVEKTKQVIHNDKLLQQQAEIGFKAFSSQRMKDSLQKVLGRRLYLSTHPSEVKMSKKIYSMAVTFKKFILRIISRSSRILHNQDIYSFDKRKASLRVQKDLHFSEKEKASPNSNAEFEWFIEKDMRP